MEYLQYSGKILGDTLNKVGFKPYYKWNTFNTKNYQYIKRAYRIVLNLIINGIPSIHYKNRKGELIMEKSFKPYYKWNTFNTDDRRDDRRYDDRVLNLIINGIPSIHLKTLS